MKKSHVMEELSNRVHDVGDVKVARGDLVQHRREEEEILPIDERDLDVAAAP